MCLLEDDAPAIGQPQGAEDRSWFEMLHQGVKVRKNLVLDDARAFAGHLVFVGTEANDNGHPLYIRINGIDIVRPPSKQAHPSARQYYTNDWGGSHFDNWFVVEVPVEALKPGENEIVLWAESDETSWEIMVAADEEYPRGSSTRVNHPNHSAKSIDDGISWDFEHLGWKNKIDGEYCIRLSLDRYVLKGTYVSPVIDLAGGTGVVKQFLEIVNSRINWEVDIPEECSAEIRMRQGNSPLARALGSSDYIPVNDNVAALDPPSGRYIQFEIVLQTTNPLVTPRLLSVTIESTLMEQQQTDRWFYNVQNLHNGRVVRSSVEYTYEEFANLEDLRQDFELDKVIAGAASEFEAQLRLMGWAYKVPLSTLDPYAWNYYDLLKPERDEKGCIVLHKQYDKRRRDGHCLYCNLSLVAACIAMGYPARWVNISSKHTYGHEVAEVWSNEFNKWIFMDSTRDYYIYDPDTGIPLNLVEISHRLGEIMPGPATWEYPVQWHLPKKSMLDKVRIAYREGDHQYSVLSEDEIEGEELLMYKGHLQMPLRNNFASHPHPVPWRLSSNWGGDQFFCYYSEMFPRKQEYQHHSKRWQDFNPTLNQAELFLYETEKAGVLRVEVDTETPCLDTFLVQLNRNEFQEHKQGIFDWSLKEGLNHLRVKIRNKAGICGMESCVTLVAHN
ncbi:MAG: transglutaminase-like domain-containing protein [Candidatus Latescibacterota bacterium]|nr:transglutaminase-like domain-containing protein [Candidatus Latescibacterota bacterium]